MAKIEIDEAEYNRLSALHGIASKIVANPAARRRLEEAQKLVDPNAPTPMLDADRLQAEPVNALKTELSTEIAALRKEREDEKRENALARIASEQERGFRRLKTEHRYTDEGVEAIRKLMETKGLIDVDDAVAIFERANPPQMPASPSGGLTGPSWGFTDTTAESDQAVKDLIGTKGDVESIVDRMAMTALNEFRQQARR
jgi:antitoxin component HigA of HigAB toxin-antitoxin module